MADIRTNIRMPEALYEDIKRLAEQDLRTINAEMVRLLQEAVAARRRSGKEGQDEEIIAPDLALAV